MNNAETAVENSTRPQRPAAQRQAPLRRPPLGLPASVGAALQGAMDAAVDSGQTLGAGLGAAMRQGLDSAQDLGATVGAGVGLGLGTGAQGFVEGGVNTAYQVIEAYMRRGQEAAQRLSPLGPQPARPGPVADVAQAWAQNLAGPLGQTASSLAVPWLQLVRAWVDGLSTLAPMVGQVAGQVAGQMAGQGSGPAAELARMGVFNGLRTASAGTPMQAAGPGFANGSGVGPAPATVNGQPAAAAGLGGSSATHSAATSGAAAAAAAAGPRAKVTLEFMSHQPAQIAVSLEPGADLAAMRAEWPAQDGVTSAPASVVLYSSPGHVHVRLTLADPPLPGNHLATLTDDQGRCWGSMQLVIAGPAAAAGGPAAH